MRFVPVLSPDGMPLMPTNGRRARILMERGEAKGFWSKGLFCIRLIKEPSGRDLQPIAVGVDPGSKKEGLSVVSEVHTYLNVQADAVTHVKDKVEAKREMRRTRRFRKTPCRKNRINRKRGGIPPSTKARWDWKRRLVAWLSTLFPITTTVVEDIRARTKGKRRWDSAFSPLEVGKAWFYDQIRAMPDQNGGSMALVLRQGFETHQMRTKWFDLSKTKDKMAERFEAHAVDAWCLAADVVGALAPTQMDLLCIEQPIVHRRNLHRRQPAQGGVRAPYGGTRSLGLKRGSLVRHFSAEGKEYGLCTIGGAMQGRGLSLNALGTGKRLCQNAKVTDLTVLALNFWRMRHLPASS